MALSDFIKSLTKSSLLAHLKNVDQKTMKWRKDLLDAVVTKDELKDWFAAGGTSHTHNFLQLTDTPTDYTGDGGKVVSVNVGEDALEFTVPSGGAETFLDLTDTPADYTGDGGKIVAVNVGEDALEFIAAPVVITDHGGLDGLSDDDHAQYLLASDATDRATFASNWTDLTDSGETTLHTHPASGLTQAQVLALGLGA